MNLLILWDEVNCPLFWSLCYIGVGNMEVLQLFGQVI